MMVRKYRRKKETKYTVDQLNEAVKAVRTKLLNSYDAAEKYKIPRSTIISRVYGTRGTKMTRVGRPGAFPVEVEEKIASYIHILEKCRYPLTKKEMIAMIAEYIRRNGIVNPFRNDIPGKEWFLAFRKRHKLSFKKPKSVEIACTAESENNPFQKSEEVLIGSVSLTLPEHNVQSTGVILYPACNICKEDIVGFRYVCVQCSDWDMCSNCEISGAHSHHYVLRLPKTNVPQSDLLTLIETIQQKLELLQETMEIKNEFPIDIKEEELTSHSDVDYENFFVNDIENMKYKPNETSQDLSIEVKEESLEVPAAEPDLNQLSMQSTNSLETNDILIKTKEFCFHITPSVKTKKEKEEVVNILDEHAYSSKGKYSALCNSKNNQLQRIKKPAKKKILKPKRKK